MSDLASKQILYSGHLYEHPNFNKLLVRPSDSIRNALSAINTEDLKIVVLLYEDGRNCRTLTDGDIRRALLSGASIDDPVSILPRKYAVTLPAGTDDETTDATTAD